MAGPVVGLDIGTQQIKVAELTPGKGGRLTVTALGVAPTPPGVMQNNIITDSKLMGQAVKQLLRESGVRAKKVVGSVAGQSAVVIRIIEVPKMTDAELKETMKWEVERHVPFAPSETIMDYRPLASMDAQSENNPNMEVLLAVAQQDIIANYVDTLFAAGLDPSAIDIEPLAGARALLDITDGQPVVRPLPVLTAPAEENLYGSSLHDTVAVVNIGASNTDISIFQDGQLAFPRSLPLAGDSLTRAIGEMMGQAPDQAERMKRELGAVQLDRMAVYTGTAYEDADSGYDAPGFEDDAPDFVVSSIPDDDAPVFNNPFETPAEEGLSGGSAFQTTPEGPQFDEAERTQPIPQRTLNLARKPENEGYLSSDPDAFPDPGLSAASGDSSALRDQVFEAIAPVLGELATELRRSLDYYRSRAQGRSVDRMIIAGGSASLTNLAHFLQNELQVPVIVADPLAGLEVLAKNYDPQYLHSLAPVFTVAVGLAARDAVFAANPVARPPKPTKTSAKTKTTTGQPVNVTSPPTS